jgi:hypothetical protein
MSNKHPTKTPPDPDRALAAAAGVLQAAEQVLADLQVRRGDMLARQAELDIERKRLSFSAYTTAGDGARLLDELRTEVAGLDVELADIGNAIEVGKQRVSDARAALEQIGGEQRRHQVAAELKKLQDVCQRIDQTLVAFTAASREATDIVSAINKLGRAYPNGQQFNVLGYRALLTVFAGTTWANRFERQPPSARVTFGELADKWAAQPDNKQTDEVAA